MWDEPYTLEPDLDQNEHQERVLVAVVPSLDDWQHIREDHWYRIPVARAPKRMAADYVAFYHPKCFDEWRWSIRFYAPINAYRIVKRCELLPNEPAHPRADELYYKLELEELLELDRPIPSPHLRRITFINTTLTSLFTAEDVKSLWLRSSATERLWQALQTREISALTDYAIREDRVAYYPDLVVLCRRRNLAIECVSGEQGRTCDRELWADECWAIERFQVEEIMRDVAECAAWVTRFVVANGGLRIPWSED